MGRKKQLISFARLNDCHGDLTGKWYVEYAYRIPDGGDDIHRYRIYDGLCSGTEEERRTKAAKLIETINEYLKSGEYLNHSSDYSPVRPTDSHREEQQRYEERLKQLRVDYLTSRYITILSPSIRKKSKETYSSKFKYLCKYVHEELEDKTVNRITREDMISFFAWLATNRNLCRCTIHKYIMITKSFFDWCEDMGYRELRTNPVYKIPRYGKVIDCSPVPFTMDERRRLKEAIWHKEPYLWLACEMQYYCAIRPGMELRLLKIGQIDRDRSAVTIPCDIAKNKRTETVGVPKDLMELIEKLGIFNYPANYYVFGKWGIPGCTPLGRNTMRNRFNLYREELGISPDHKFYSWKHTGAITAIENDIPVRKLKDYMRHKDLSTTMEYIQRMRPEIGGQDGYIDKI